LDGGSRDGIAVCDAKEMLHFSAALRDTQGITGYPFWLSGVVAKFALGESKHCH
jgi:hypothetical protein